MNLTKRVEAVEAALAKQSGETGYKLATRSDGESEAVARERVGLGDCRGQVVFLSPTDARL